MRKTGRSHLGKELVQNVDFSVESVASCIVDTSWLLHEVKWQHDGVYRDVVNQYSQFINKHVCTDVTMCLMDMTKVSAQKITNVSTGHSRLLQT